MFNSTLYMAITTVAERTIVRSGVPRALFSIGKFKEDAVCIERIFRKGELIVYEGMNGEKANMSTYNSPVLAVSEFIDRVYDKMEEEKEKYQELLSKMNSQEEQNMSRTIELLDDESEG